MIIQIEPREAFPSPATQLRVDDGHVTLGQSANFQYALLDADGNLVSVPARNTLTTEQYEAWTGDDEFVAQCVAENIGLTPIIP
jgi:hypothetical protein